MIKRSVMTLYSGINDLCSHQTRIVLAEKGVTVDVKQENRNHLSEDLLQLNPYATLPTLVDRDLVLYNADIIMEYLEERFPHPPLLPVYPVARAKCRLNIYRIKKDWFSLVDKIENGTPEESTAARNELRDGLITLIPVFNEKPYFLSDEFTFVDCTIAPLLWRLSHLGIKLPPQTKPIQKYAERVFSRDSFQASLTENEREMQENMA